MDYISYSLAFSTLDPWRDIAVSEMAELGFESFVETKQGLKGYIAVNANKAVYKSIILNYEGVSEVDVEIIVGENWNQKWEENFDPVYVENKLAIIAPFHTNYKKCALTVTIQPQMSFGTGHHQTTWLMSQQLMSMSLKGKKLLDMGTGTGVLAILAEKLGAQKIIAPDIDEWSYNNAKDNCLLNKSKEITVLHGGHEVLGEDKFDVILANINKNTLIANFSLYSKALVLDGSLLLSGFFCTDKDDLCEHAANNGFVFEKEVSKDEWSMLEFKRK